VISLPCRQSGLCRRVCITSCIAAFLVSSAAFPQTKPSPTQTFKQLSEQAEKASEGNRLEEAAALYRKALALRPRWSDGWWSLGTIEYDQNHYAKAAQAFEKLLTLDQKNGTAHAMLGLCQSELGQDQQAFNNLVMAEHLGILKNRDLRNVALFHLGILQLRLGRYGGAKETFGQLSRDKIRSKELTNGLGLAALMIKPQDAPPDGTAGATVVERTGQAEVLLTANEFDQANQMYTLLITEFPSYPNLHFAFGRLLLETHDTDSAVQQFQLELERDPDHVNSMLQIAVALQLIDPQGGLKYAERAAQLSPKLPFAHYILGMLRLETGNPAGAIPELEIAQKAFPAEAGVYFSLGKAYARVGRKADAASARAEFARLNALAAKEKQGPTIYGEEKRSLDKEKPIS
jgi:tetratricopeptide (TPR) repeat protein